MTEKTVPLSIQLLSNTPMQFDRRLYVSSLQKFSEKTDLLELSNNMIHAFHHHLPLFSNERSIVTQSILTHSSAFTPPDNIQEIFEQSWSFLNAQEVVSECRYSISLNDFMGPLNDPLIRIHLFNDIIQAALEVFPNTTALYWENSQCFVDPKQFIHAVSEDKTFVNGPINVRLYKIANQDHEEETLMDTLGMEVFNLPDLQCHFINLEAAEVARFLFNTSKYLLEYGNVIQPGNTIQGILSEHRWECQYQNSLVQPHRILLNVNTGLG